MFVTAVVLVSVLGRSSQGMSQSEQPLRTLYFKTLPSGTKPKLTPAVLQGQPLVSAAEYQIETQFPTRLFRYSFKGNIDQYVGTAIKKSKGWSVQVMRDNRGRPGQGCMITSPTTSGAVREQSIIILPGRYVTDRSARGGSRKVMTKGWISVSYNEVLP